LVDRPLPPRRDTRGKPTLDFALQGDRDLADALRRAIAVEDRDDDLTHGFHTYPAGLHPSAARRLVELAPGRSVRDPFCGGGTVLVEAMRAGRDAWGTDLSPVAVAVARCRTTLIDDPGLTAMRSAARRITEAARGWRTQPPRVVLSQVGDWYAPHVLAELHGLALGVAASPDSVRPLLEVAFSSILVKASYRRSDTSMERDERERPPGTTAILFHKKVRELGRRLEALRLATPGDTPPARVVRADARGTWAGGTVDLVLTSPPYPGVYDYLAIQDLRAAWLGFDLPVEREIASRSRWSEDFAAARAEWQADTFAWIREAKRALAPGGALVIVIGDGLVGERTVDAASPTITVANQHGLRLRAGAALARPDHARRSVRREHVLWFEA
jgi:SAM-dependent methyltransferase